MSDNFLILNKSNLIKWNEYQNERAVLQVESDFYKQLINTGFLVDECKDEYSTLIREILKKDNDESSYMLIVNPTLSCNFNCWYCYESHVENSVMSDSVLHATKQFINSTLDNHPIKTFQLSFFGGEPLLRFNKVVKPLLEYCTELCNDRKVTLGISFTTNAFLLNQAKIEYLRQFKNVSFQITLDGSREYHNKTRFVASKPELGSYDKILEHINIAATSGMYVIVRINFTSDNLGSISLVANDLDKLIDINNRHNICVDFQRVWQDDVNEKEIDSTLDRVLAIFREKKFSISYLNKARIVTGCYADKKSGAVINYNGDVYRCTAQDFHLSPRDGKLTPDGEIIWENDIENLRGQAKFRNLLCRVCRVAPLCGGGCINTQLQNKDQSYCLYNSDDNKKDKLILSRFENVFLNQFK